MKTIIYIPDKVFESTEKLASQLGWSRSRLYTRALKIYVEGCSSEVTTKRLDEAYGKTDSSLGPAFQKAEFRSVLSKDNFWAWLCRQADGAITVSIDILGI